MPRMKRPGVVAAMAVMAAVSSAPGCRAFLKQHRIFQVIDDPQQSPSIGDVRDNRGLADFLSRNRCSQQQKCHFNLATGVSELLIKIFTDFLEVNRVHWFYPIMR